MLSLTNGLTAFTVLELGITIRNRGAEKENDLLQKKYSKEL